MAGIRADIVQVHPYRILNGRVEHLVLRRSEREEVLPSIWQVVTGGTEPGESALQAAIREVAEETGLTVLEWHITGRVATFYFAPYDAVILSPIIACLVDVGVELRLSCEHGEGRWVSADDAFSLLAFESHREGVDEVERLNRH